MHTAAATNAVAASAITKCRFGIGVLDADSIFQNIHNIAHNIYFLTMKQKNRYSIISIVGLLIILLILIAVAVVFLSEMEWPTSLSSSGIVAIISALISVIITVTVTSLLLNLQTKVESEKDHDLMKFERKQAVYHDFINELQNIVSKTAQQRFKCNDADIGPNIQRLESLFFQLGLLKLHCKEEILSEVMNNIADIMKTLHTLQEHPRIKEKTGEGTRKTLNDYDASEVNCGLYNYFREIAACVFSISALLRKDLYPSVETGMSEVSWSGHMGMILDNSGLKGRGVESAKDK